MNFSYTIAFVIILFSWAYGCGKHGHESTDSVINNERQIGRSEMIGVVLKYVKDGWRDQYGSGDECVGDVFCIKILRPEKCSGFEISIIDDARIFRKLGLNQKGKFVKLTLNQPIVDDADVFISVFENVEVYSPQEDAAGSLNPERESRVK